MDAVLWDMDGLMVDSEPLWTAAEEELARALGGTWDAEVKARIVGTRLDVAVPTILAYFGVEATPERVRHDAAWLLHRMVELFRADDLPLLPGVRALLAALADEQVPMALVSSSYRVLVDAVLAGGVGPFAVTLAGDEVEHGKPAPDPYLLAAQRLGVDVDALRRARGLPGRRRQRRGGGLRRRRGPERAGRAARARPAAPRRPDARRHDPGRPARARLRRERRRLGDWRDAGPTSQTDEP
jgi:beta-phosphoglucomutase-like phosphatase (HAD superfamily)